MDPIAFGKVHSDMLGTFLSDFGNDPLNYIKLIFFVKQKIITTVNLMPIFKAPNDISEFLKCKSGNASKSMAFSNLENI